MLRWGIIGIGETARSHVAPALRSVGHDLAVVAAPVLTQAQAFAATQGVRRARADYREVLESRDVDAVWIGLDPSERENWVEEALAHGKHVLCAKPLGADADGAARMATAAAAAGDLVLMEALPVRFHPRTTALLDLIAGGGVGDVRMVNATLSKPLGGEDVPVTNGALLQLGADLVSLVRWVMGAEPDTVRSVSRFFATGADSTTTAVLGFPNGRTATLCASLDACTYSTLEVIGTKGTLTVPEPFSATASLQAPILRNGELIGSWRADPWETLVDTFEQTTRGVRAPLDVDDAVATAHVLEWIGASA